MAMHYGMYDDKIEEVMKLLEEQEGEAVGEENPEIKPSAGQKLMQELEGGSEEVLTGPQAAMAEFAMMMKHWEALVEEYERQEAEEQNQADAEKGSGN